jgi:hypothetical protein
MISVKYIYPTSVDFNALWQTHITSPITATVENYAPLRKRLRPTSDTGLVKALYIEYDETTLAPIRKFALIKGGKWGQPSETKGR